MIKLSLFELGILGHLYNWVGGVSVQTPLNSWLGPKFGIFTLCISSVCSQHRQAVMLVA